MSSLLLEGFSIKCHHHESTTNWSLCMYPDGRLYLEVYFSNRPSIDNIKIFKMVHPDTTESLIMEEYTWLKRNDKHERKP